MDMNKAHIAERNQHIMDHAGSDFHWPENPVNGDLSIGDLTVMRSAAGYYIGSACYEFLDTEPYAGEWIGPMPYDRQSDYFATREDAAAYLSHFDD